MVVPRFFVTQRITVMVNRYEILAANPDGTEGALLAFAEQKRMKLKEEVVFFADESKSRPVFSFKARQRLDVHARHDVLDEHGTPLGSFASSSAPACCAPPGTCRRRGWRPSGGSAGRSSPIIRRVWELIPYIGEVWVPFVFHFDFHDTATGAPVLVSERRKAIRDRYDVTVPDPRLDFRVAGADGGGAGRAAEPLTTSPGPAPRPGKPRGGGAVADDNRRERHLSMRIPLSILDLAPIARGETASSSIAASVELAQHAEEHGYRARLVRRAPQHADASRRRRPAC